MVELIPTHISFHLLVSVERKTKILILFPGPVQVVVVLVVLMLVHGSTARILILVRRKSQPKLISRLVREQDVSLSLSQCEKCDNPNLRKSLRLWD